MPAEHSLRITRILADGDSAGPPIPSASAAGFGRASAVSPPGGYSGRPGTPDGPALRAARHSGHFANLRRTAGRIPPLL